MTEENESFVRRVGESPREHSARVKRGQVKRIVKSYEKAGRPDLALAVVEAPSPVVLPGRRFVGVDLICTRGHIAAAVNVYTYSKRWPDFESAWGVAGEGTGVWQSRGDAERTTVSTAMDGHRTLEARCAGCECDPPRRHVCPRPCGRPVQARLDRLESELRKLWAPDARARCAWPRTR